MSDRLESRDIGVVELQVSFEVGEREEWKWSSGYSFRFKMLTHRLMAKSGSSQYQQLKIQDDHPKAPPL